MTHASNTYPTFGALPLVPSADALDLQAAININSDTRVGGGGSGKKAGMEIWIDEGSDVFSKAAAFGSLSSDKWIDTDGGTAFLPVSLLDSGGGAGWTESAGCTYAAGLLTADGVDDPTTTQDVELEAGKYRFTGEAGYEGTVTDFDAPQLEIDGATDGSLHSEIYTGALDATAAENASPKETFEGTFTLTVQQTVTFDLSNVNEADALEAGSSYIKILTLEAY